MDGGCVLFSWKKKDGFFLSHGKTIVQSASFPLNQNMWGLPWDHKAFTSLINDVQKNFAFDLFKIVQRVLLSSRMQKGEKCFSHTNDGKKQNKTGRTTKSQLF